MLHRRPPPHCQEVGQNDVTVVKLLYGSKVLLCFEICTPDQRGRGKEGRQISKQSTQNLCNTGLKVLISSETFMAMSTILDHGI